jgi:hypothetical protein
MSFEGRRIADYFQRGNTGQPAPRAYDALDRGSNHGDGFQATRFAWLGVTVGLAVRVAGAALPLTQKRDNLALLATAHSLLPDKRGSAACLKRTPLPTERCDKLNTSVKGRNTHEQNKT